MFDILPSTGLKNRVIIKTVICHHKGYHIPLEVSHVQATCSVSGLNCRYCNKLRKCEFTFECF